MNRFVNAAPKMKENQQVPGTGLRREQSRSGSRLVLVAAVVLLLGALSYYLALKSSPPRENLVWMTPQEVQQAVQPGILDALKFRLLRRSALWNWYRKGKRQITMESRLLACSTDASEPKGLPQNVFRNADGTRCWILSSEEWINFHRELKSSIGISTLNVSRVTTLEDGATSISSGTMTVDSLPRIVGSSFDVLVCAIGTTGSPATIQTNFAMAGRVKIPNGGAMVVSGPGSSVPGATNYWYVLSSQATDPAGNSINL